MKTARLPGPVPGLFDRQSINLIIGTSGTGKTPFLLNQLEKYAAGSGFLNYAPCLGTPWQMGLIACAGTEGTILDVLIDFPILNDQTFFPFEVWSTKPEELDLDALDRTYNELNSLLPEGRGPIKLLIVEDFQSLMTSGDTHKIKAVKDFCRNLHEFCAKYDVTIVATIGNGKAKVNESYPQIADRIPGANCWGAELDSLIAIELIDLHKQPELRPEVRRVIVKTRKAPIAVHWASFVDGRLEIIPAYIPVEDLTPAETFLEKKLGAIEPGARLKKTDFRQWLTETTIEISVSTLGRWLSDRVKDGALKREGKANRTIYTKARAQ